jgi:RNA chaperone Hfq
MNSSASSNSKANDRVSHDLKLQDVFLNQCRRSRIPVAIHFMDQSIKYGQIIGFDHNSIIFETSGRQCLAFKAAVCLIDPQENFDYIFNESTRPDEQSTFINM